MRIGFVLYHHAHIARTKLLTFSSRLSRRYAASKARSLVDVAGLLIWTCSTICHRLNFIEVQQVEKRTSEAGAICIIIAAGSAAGPPAREHVQRAPEGRRGARRPSGSVQSAHSGPTAAVPVSLGQCALCWYLLVEHWRQGDSDRTSQDGPAWARRRSQRTLEYQGD